MRRDAELASTVVWASLRGRSVDALSKVVNGTTKDHCVSRAYTEAVQDVVRL